MHWQRGTTLMVCVWGGVLKVEGRHMFVSAWLSLCLSVSACQRVSACLSLCLHLPLSDRLSLTLSLSLSLFSAPVPKCDPHTHIPPPGKLSNANSGSDALEAEKAALLRRIAELEALLAELRAAKAAAEDELGGRLKVGGELSGAGGRQSRGGAAWRGAED